MTDNGPPYAHDPAGMYGNYWCKRCQAPLTGIDGEPGDLGCPVAPEPPPSTGTLFDQALQRRFFGMDAIDAKFGKGRR